MEPDYDHYCMCPTWTLEEALALSFGKDPERVNTKLLAPYASAGPVARRYMQRWDQMRRAKSVGQLWDPVLPTIFLAWARNLGIDLPDALKNRAVNRGISLKNWQNLYEEMVERQKKREEEVEAAMATWRVVWTQPAPRSRNR